VDEDHVGADFVEEVGLSGCKGVRLVGVNMGWEWGMGHTDSPFWRFVKLGVGIIAKGWSAWTGAMVAVSFRV